MTTEEARAMVKRYGNARQAAKAAHMRTSSFNAIVRGDVAETDSKPRKGHQDAPQTAQKRAGRTLAEFRAEYDKDTIIPSKVRDGIRALGDGWEYEVAFAKLCGVSLADLGNYRDLFADNIVVVRRDGKRAWAGKKSVAAAMREMLA